MCTDPQPWTLNPSTPHPIFYKTQNNLAPHTLGFTSCGPHAFFGERQISMDRRGNRPAMEIRPSQVSIDRKRVPDRIPSSLLPLCPTLSRQGLWTCLRRQRSERRTESERLVQCTRICPSRLHTSARVAYLLRGRISTAGRFPLRRTSSRSTSLRATTERPTKPWLSRHPPR